MRFLRGAGAAVALVIALAACGGATPSSNTASGGGGASTATPSPTPAQAALTASFKFSGGVSGVLDQPTKVACQATPFNIYVSIVGPVGSTSYDLELEAYAFTGSGAGTFTVGGSPNAAAQFGTAQQRATYGAASGSITLESKSSGMVSMTLNPSDTAAGLSPVTVLGSWSCASVG